MRKSAVAASTIAAVGLMGLGGTAFADSGASASDTGEDATTTTQAQPVNHDVQATAPEGRDLVGVNAPIALDLHEGVANNLNAAHAVHDVVRVGDVVPAAGGNTGGDAGVQARQGGDAGNTKGDAQGGTAAPAAPNVTAANVGHADANAQAAGGNAVGNAAAGAEAHAKQVGGAVGDVVANATATVNNVTTAGQVSLSR